MLEIETAIWDYAEQGLQIDEIVEQAWAEMSDEDVEYIVKDVLRSRALQAVRNSRNSTPNHSPIRPMDTSEIVRRVRIHNLEEVVFAEVKLCTTNEEIAACLLQMEGRIMKIPDGTHVDWIEATRAQLRAKSIWYRQMMEGWGRSKANIDFTEEWLERNQLNCLRESRERFHL